MRIYVAVITALIVAGCAPQVPESNSGIGFESLQEYQGNREAELAGTGPITLDAQISDESVATGSPLPTTSTIPTTPAPSVELNRNNPTISDEQDFSAVAARESIESDAQRRAAQQQAYQVIEPTALPTRRGQSSASIVEFALATTNVVGQSVYQRSSLSGNNRFQRNCGKYPSQDLAQAAFLKNGGPERDRQGIDPDGDGFACFWDPAPFRQAVRN